jgi:adenylate cyclase
MRARYKPLTIRKHPGLLGALGQRSPVPPAGPGVSWCTASLLSGTTLRGLPPLSYSLERLYLGENRLMDDILHPLTVLHELRVLNLSFNDIQEMPPSFFKTLIKLEELYLSGNKLTSIPTEDMHRLVKLHTLFFNGNKLKSLPTELGKINSLMALDVGSNML